MDTENSVFARNWSGKFGLRERGLTNNRPRVNERITGRVTKRAKTKEEAGENGRSSLATKEKRREGGRERRELHRDYRMQYDSHLDADSAPHGICMTC